MPFSAGGGSDTFTRIIQQSVAKNRLLPHPLVIINVPGAGGTVGSRRAKNARPDGYTILQLHEGILTSKYSGNSEYGPEAFAPIAGTGEMSHVIAVPEKSAFNDINELLRAAADTPDEVVFAVGIGAPSHFAGLMLENAVDGAKFRFTQSGGGAKRFASLLGGHSDVTTFSVSEFIDFQSSGLRALAILSETRHKMVPNVLTAKEQGVDVVSTNMHFWWAPVGTPPERVQTIATALERAMKTNEVQQQLRDLATENRVVRGEELASDLQIREQQISGVSGRTTPSLPNFPGYVFALTLVAGVFAARASLRRQAGTSGDDRAALPGTKIAEPLAIALVLITYVGTLHLGLLRFDFATLAFVVIGGGILTRRRKSLLPAVLALAIVAGFGLHALFTNVLVVDLP